MCHNCKSWSEHNLTSAFTAYQQLTTKYGLLSHEITTIYIYSNVDNYWISDHLLELKSNLSKSQRLNPKRLMSTTMGLESFYNRYKLIFVCQTNQWI